MRGRERGGGGGGGGGGDDSLAHNPSVRKFSLFLKCFLSSKCVYNGPDVNS